MASHGDLAPGLSDQRGLTLIEVVIAIMIFVIGTAAILAVVNLSSRNGFRAQQQQVAVNVAQRELETMRNLSYSQVALTLTPSTSGSSLDPRSRVSGTSFNLKKTGPADNATMVINGVSGVSGGIIDPGPTSFTSGDVSGQVYRFVVWQDDPSISGTQDFKRLIVAISINGSGLSGTSRGYSEVQSDFSNTRDGPTSSTSPSPGTESDAISYFLSDTQANPCDPSYATPSAHNTHDTTGSCATGSAPDYTFAAPQFTGSGTPDYSQDVTGAAGLQMTTQAGSSCNLAATKLAAHRWVSPTLNVSASTKSTLTVFTRQPTATPQAGKICVWIYQPFALGSNPLNAPAVLLGLAGGSSATVADPGGSSWTCSAHGDLVTTLSGVIQFVCNTSAYPTSWDGIQIKMVYPQSLGTISRLNLGIGVLTQNATNPIEFEYDSPSYPSRIDLCLQAAGACLI
jgi:prepilin-type N-terminal cleavage/methylation domain-containing protein